MKLKINPYLAIFIINLPIFFIIRLLHIPSEYIAGYFLILIGFIVYRQYWANTEVKK